MDRDAVVKIVLRAMDQTSGVLAGVGRGFKDLGDRIAAAGKQAKGFGGDTLAEIGRLKDAVHSIFPVLEKIWGVGVKVATALSGAFLYVTNRAADFEKSMSAVGAVLRLNARDMSALNSEALELGRVTVFSSLDAAKAMEILSRQGITAKQILDGAARSVMNLAAATGDTTQTGLASAAGIASSAVQVFNLKGGAMRTAVDAIAGAVNKSQMTLMDYQFALKAVGSQANMVKWDIGETSTVLAMFARNGLKGESAGTMLARMLQYMVPHTKAAAEAMRDLGIITEDGKNQFYDATGTLKGAREVMGVLADATRGLTDEQKNLALTAIFGMRAQRGVSLAIAEGTAGYDRMQKAMRESTAEEIAARRMDNWKGALERLSGTWETLTINIGRGFLPGGKDLFLWADRILQGLTPLSKWWADQGPAALDKLQKKLLDFVGIDLGDLKKKFQPITDFLDSLNSDTGFGSKRQGMAELPEFDTTVAEASIDRFWIAVRKSATNVFGEENMKKYDRFVNKTLPDILDVLGKIADTAGTLATRFENFAKDIWYANDRFHELQKTVSGIFSSFTPKEWIKGIGLMVVDLLTIFAPKRWRDAAEKAWLAVVDYFAGWFGGGKKLNPGKKDDGPAGVLSLLGLEEPEKGLDAWFAKVTAWFKGLPRRVLGLIGGVPIANEGETTPLIDKDWEKKWSGRQSENVIDVRPGAKNFDSVAAIGLSPTPAKELDFWFERVTEWFAGIPDRLAISLSKSQIPGALWISWLVQDPAEALGAISNRMAEGLNAAASNIGLSLQGIGADISTNWDTYYSLITTKGQAIWDDVSLKWSSTWATIDLWAATIGSTVATKWDEFKTTAATKGQELLDDTTAKWTATSLMWFTKLEEIRLETQTKFDLYTSIISVSMTATSIVVSDKAQGILDDLTEKWRLVNVATDFAYTALKMLVGRKLEETKADAISKVTAIHDAVVTWWTNIHKKTDYWWTAVKILILSKIDEAKRDAIEKAKEWMEVGREIIAGIKKGFMDRLDQFKHSIHRSLMDALGWIKEHLLIFSPSRLTMPWGFFLVEGIRVGWEERIPALIQAMLGVVPQIEEVTRKVAQRISDGLSSALQQAGLSPIKLGLELTAGRSWTAFSNGLGGPLMGLRHPGQINLQPGAKPIGGESTRATESNTRAILELTDQTRRSADVLKSSVYGAGKEYQMPKGLANGFMGRPGSGTGVYASQTNWWKQWSKKNNMPIPPEIDQNIRVYGRAGQEYLKEVFGKLVGKKSPLDPVAESAKSLATSLGETSGVASRLSVALVSLLNGVESLARAVQDPGPDRPIGARADGIKVEDWRRMRPGPIVDPSYIGQYPYASPASLPGGDSNSLPGPGASSNISPAPIGYGDMGKYSLVPKLAEILCPSNGAGPYSLIPRIAKRLSLPGGDSNSLPGAGRNSLPGGDSNSLPGGDGNSLPGGDGNSLPGGDGNSLPGGDGNRIGPEIRDALRLMAAAIDRLVTAGQKPIEVNTTLEMRGMEIGRANYRTGPTAAWQADVYTPAL